MAKKPKALRPEAEEKTQAEQFIEAARQIGADETGEAFERAFTKIVSAAPKRRPKVRARSKPA
jgi:hypothetical protein